MSVAGSIEQPDPPETRPPDRRWSAAHQLLHGTTYFPPFGQLLAAGLAYHLLARLGVALGLPPEGIAVFWPPNAIILCTLLVVPRRHWGAFLLAFLGAEVVSDVPAFSVVEALGFGIVNCFEGALSAGILRRLFKGEFALATSRQLWYFVIVAVIGVPALAAVGGATIYLLIGSNESFLTLWRTWWLGDAVGLAAFAPIVLVLWRKRRERTLGSFGPAYWIELGLALAALAAAAGVAFNAEWPIATTHFRLFYIYPVLVWIALRCQVLGAAAASAFTACFVTWLAVIGEILVGASGRFEDVLFLQQFLAVTSLATLTLAVLANEMAALNRKLGLELAQSRSQQEILEAKDLAERANEAKTTFLAHMSHELRTPLNAIIGFSGVIRSEILGPIHHARYAEYIRDIEQSAQHLLALINDSIDIARVEGGRLVLSDDVVESSAAIDDVFRLLGPTASKKRISLKNLCGRQLPRLRCDEVRLRQILINLIGNAIKFSDDGSTVETFATQERGVLSFSVRDHGSGIPADRVPLAFDRFRQFSADPHIRAQGSGLGLYVTRMLMEAHNGRASLDSTVGKGTTVTVTFPPERVVL